MTAASTFAVLSADTALVLVRVANLVASGLLAGAIVRAWRTKGVPWQAMAGMLSIVLGIVMISVARLDDDAIHLGTICYCLGQWLLLWSVFKFEPWPLFTRHRPEK